MVLINGVKYACERCIRGHRVTTCTHTDQPLTMIKPKGRPASQCQHCRDQRKLKAHHVACTCGKKGKSPGTHLASCLCHKNSHCTCSNKNVTVDTRKKKVVKSLVSSSSSVSLDSMKNSGTPGTIQLPDTPIHIAPTATPMSSNPTSSIHLNGSNFTPVTSSNLTTSASATNLRASARSTPSPQSQSKKDFGKSTALHSMQTHLAKNKNASSSSLNGYSKQIFQQQQQQLMQDPTQATSLFIQNPSNQQGQLKLQSPPQPILQSQDLNSQSGSNIPNIDSNFVIEDVVFPFDASTSGGLFDMFGPSDLSETSSQITLNGPNGAGNSGTINGFNGNGLNGIPNFNAANSPFSVSNGAPGINNGQSNGFASNSNTNIQLHSNPNMNLGQKNPQSPTLDNIFPLFPLVGSFTLDEGNNEGNNNGNNNNNNNGVQSNSNNGIPTQVAANSATFSNPSQGNSSVLTSPTGVSFNATGNHSGYAGVTPHQPKPMYAGNTNSQYYSQTHRPRRPESVLSVTSNSSTATNQLAAYPPSASGAHHLGINRNNSILSFDSLPLQHHPKTQKKAVLHHHEIPIKEHNDDLVDVLSRSQSVEPGYGTTLPLAPSAPSLTDVAALTLLTHSQSGLNGTKMNEANELGFNGQFMANSGSNGNDFTSGGSNPEIIPGGSNGMYGDNNGKLPSGNLFSFDDYAPMLDGFNDLMSPVFGSEPTEFMG